VNEQLTTSLMKVLVPIFVLVMTGFGVRRLGLAGAKGAEWMGKLVLLWLFPVLVFHRLAITPDAGQILADWPALAWAPVVLIGSALIGWAMHRALGLRAEWRTYTYLVGMPNWIYLPLAVAGPLWGDEAVRLIVLFNIPTQLLLWTAGIALLHGDLRGTHALRYMLTSPGLLATVAGLLVAFRILPVTLLEGQPGLSLQPLEPLLRIVGGFTVPLSLVALGLYVGERTEARAEVLRGAAAVVMGRLVVAPLILIGVVLVAGLAGTGGHAMIRKVVYLIAVMPVAVSTPLFAAMFNRDRFLASRAVVLTTMAGFITAPLLVMLALWLDQQLGL
jgi:predicted permease